MGAIRFAPAPSPLTRITADRNDPPGGRQWANRPTTRGGSLDKQPPHVVELDPVGSSVFYMLAIALGCGFGVLGVLLGLRVAVRLISRDEERYQQVLKTLETYSGEMGQLRIAWGKTLEEIGDLAVAVERSRRRASASLSAAEKKERETQEEQPRQLSSFEQRLAISRRMKGGA